MNNKKATRAQTLIMNIKRICPKSKRSLSTIVATMLIILLSIAAVSMLWMTITGIINNVSLSPEINCFDIKIQPPITIQSACQYENLEYPEHPKKFINVTLKRNLQNIEINKITFLANNEEWQCSNDCGSCFILSQSQTKTYTLPATNQQESIAIKIGDCLINSKDVEEC